MKKSNKILFISLVIFFVSLSSVSAMDNDAIITNDNTVVEDNPIQLALGNTDDAILTSSQVTVSEGSSIQSAIDNAEAGSTIIVQNGTYSEDIIVPKALSIVGEGAIIKSNNFAFNILPTANTTSISGFNIFVSSDEGVGIFVDAGNCKITDNEISGGKVGILSEANITSLEDFEIDMIENITVIGNIISNCCESGISIKAFNPTISNNNITNIVSKKEKAYGIHVDAIDVISGLKVFVTDNYVSNIKSSENAYGIDVWGLSIMESTRFDTSGNTISNIVAPHKAVGMTNVVFSLDSNLPFVIISDVNISDISSSGQENSAATGLDLYAITIGQTEKTDAIIRNVQINNLAASGAKSSARGIVAVGVGCVDLFVLNNNVNNLKSSNSAKGITTIGIDFHDFNSYTSVSTNHITDFDASKIKGINVFSLGDAEINQNLLYNLPSEDSVFITGNALRFDLGKVYMTAPESEPVDDLLGSSIIDNIINNLPIADIMDEIIGAIKKLEELFNDSSIIIDGNLSMTGNNLEGTGTETGFAVLKPSTMNYNRATNLKNNVIKESTRSFLLESLGINPDIPSKDLVYSLIRSQKIFDKIPDEVVRNISDHVGVVVDKFFEDLDEVTAGDVDAKYNWWGSNSMPPASKFKNNDGNVLYDPWLTLRVYADPEVIGIGESSKITADVHIDSAGSDQSFDEFAFFNGPKVTLSTDKGSFDGEKSVTLDWFNGQASIYLKGDEVGLANVSAYDYDTAYTNVTILGDNPTPVDPVDPVGPVDPVDPVGPVNPVNPVGPEKNISSNVASAKILPATGNPMLLLFVVFMLFTSVVGYRKK